MRHSGLAANASCVCLVIRRGRVIASIFGFVFMRGHGHGDEDVFNMQEEEKSKVSEREDDDGVLCAVVVKLHSYQPSPLTLTWFEL